MRRSEGAERQRAGFAFAVFAGSLLAVPMAGVLLPALGVPTGFLALGLVVGACVFLVLVKSIGPLRALLLALTTAAIAAAAFGVLAFGVCVATGCVG